MGAPKTTVELTEGDAARLARAFWEAEAGHDLDAIVALYAPDAVFEGPGFEVSGLDEIRQLYEGFFSRNAELEVELRRIADHGDEAFVEFYAHEVPREGDALFVRGTSSFRTRDALIVDQVAAYHRSPVHGDETSFADMRRRQLEAS